MNNRKAIFCWSGGKDSAFCLNKVLKENHFDVKYLLTTLNDQYKRVSMHGVREELLDLQAQSIGIPLIKARVTEGTNSEYENQMESVLLKAKTEGIDNVIYGDIFLEDLRLYRENNLAKVGMAGVFPLWKRNTKDLIQDFIGQGFKTVICCTNDGYLGSDWLGKEIDGTFLEKLPAGVDPCGENGEFHTFCYEGPLFNNMINFTIGEKVYKPLEIKTDIGLTSQSSGSTKGFWFCDLIPR